jgi:5-hydroxyisourate hydrolase-like protein (transthyretin family)
MLDLNFWRGPFGSGSFWLRTFVRVISFYLLGLTFLGLTLSSLFISSTAYAGDMAVKLYDAQSLQPLGNTQITAYRLNNDGDRSWYSSLSTNDAGLATFSLEAIEDDQVYVLGIKTYNDFRSFSEPLNQITAYDFALGKVRIALKNGSEAGFPAFANQPVVIKTVAADGEFNWYDSATTDDNGLLRLNLPNISQSQSYVIRAKSAVSGQSKYSDVIGSEGDFNFVVGNPPLTVALLDGQSHTPLANQKVTVYQLNDNNERHWHTSNITDDNGVVLFDLDGLGLGSRYALGAKVFNDHRSYTQSIDATGAFTFEVGATVINVINGSVSPAQPLAEHKVTIYERFDDGSKVYFTSVYSDANGLVRIDLPELGDGKSYLGRAKSITDGKTYYQSVIEPQEATKLSVGNTPLTVTLTDALSGDSIAAKKIAAYQVLPDGNREYFTEIITDANGLATFDLPDLGSGKHYQLGVRGFDDFKSYSPVIDAPGVMSFNVGAVAVQLVNGTQADLAPLVDTKLTVMSVQGETNVWFGSATSDAQGQVRLDLPGIDSGVIYRFKAPSPVNGASKYSELATHTGNFDFVVGNPQVTVRLANALSGALYANAEVTAYQVNDTGDYQWYDRVTTGQDAVAVFDLDGITQNQRYLFKTSQFASGSSYSQPISNPGEVNFLIGAVPVTLINKDNDQLMANVNVTAYRIKNNGQLSWIKSGDTNSAGQLTFDLQGLGEGARFVFKARDPFGEGERYYGPMITSTGPRVFRIKQGEFGDLDLTPPIVEIEGPGTDIANADGFTVWGVASDNQAVSFVEISVVDAVIGTNKIEASFDDTSGRWEAHIPGQWITVLQEATVVATAFDYALNNTSVSRDYLVTQDVEDPLVTITSHQSLDPVNTLGFTVLGTVTDNIGVASIVASVSDPLLGQTVIEQPLNISLMTDQWAFMVSNGKVSPDQQVTVTLLATDFNGKTHQQSVVLSSLQQSTNPLQLAHRITFGLTPELLARLKQGDDILTEQLNPDSIDDEAFETGMTMMNITDWNDLKDYLVTYMTGSKKQLREVMAWFWENHFNTDINVHGFVDFELRENNQFRQHALGKFRDLLASSAKSPAMIHYLSNTQNIVGSANENYAREVMELHTLGVDGGYSANDIAELGRVFTGWHEFDGVFTFNDNLHDNSDKTFLGQTIVGAGVEEGEQVLDMLSSHPSTARFICGKLLTLFVSDQPLNTLQQQCGAEFLATDGDIRAILRVILGSQEFNAPAHYRSKVKTPLELMISMARGFNGQINPQAMNDELRRMGMTLFEFGEPTGFSEVAQDWLNSNAVLQRMRLANQVAWHGSDAFVIDFRQLLQAQDYSSAEAVVSFLFELALANDFTDLEYQIALDILNAQGGFDLSKSDADDKLSRLLGTVLSFPGYQYQ